MTTSPSMGNRDSSSSEERKLMYGLYATSALAVVDFVFCVILAVCFYRRSRRNSKSLTRDLESVSAVNPPVATEQHIQTYMVNPPMTSEQHIQTYVSRCTHDSDPTCSSMGGTLLHSIPSPTLLPPPAVLFPPSAEVMPCACSASPAPHDRSGYISMRNDVTMVSSTLNRVQPGAMSRALARTRRMSMSVPDMTSPPPSPMALYPSHMTHSKSRSRPRLAATMNPPYRRNRFEDFPRSFFPEMSDEDSTAEDDDGDAPRYLSASENCSRYVRDTSVRIHEGEVIYSSSRSDVRKSLGAQSDDYMPMTSTLTPQPAAASNSSNTISTNTSGNHHSHSPCRSNLYHSHRRNSA
ncbi:uncharacterized protein LOC112557952 [Pomacea canaliculata]|uniref:uncharacterized protein LOC112557952 n=1 Tax=Pomacea canaliculata TaxID=400727 RepID=UPI000D734EE6|nr:uncharacterized protein LOC112557952 [Pomacea canaliculata]